ncbi:zgc [Acrasis kona]|uniref:Zgc n=1 Tax=Acrasis kona TaxID=1008807 RepID=A0AAW2Z6W4_9EUKA
MLVVTQVALVAAKLDGAISASYRIINIPTYFLVFMITCPITICARLLCIKIQTSIHTVFCTFSTLAIGMIPFVVVLTLKLDGVVTASYTVVFIPVYIVLSTAMCCLCFVVNCLLARLHLINTLAFLSMNSDIIPAAPEQEPEQ